MLCSTILPHLLAYILECYNIAKETRICRNAYTTTDILCVLDTIRTYKGVYYIKQMPYTQINA